MSCAESMARRRACRVVSAGRCRWGRARLRHEENRLLWVDSNLADGYRRDLCLQR